MLLSVMPKSRGALGASTTREMISWLAETRVVPDYGDRFMDIASSKQFGIAVLFYASYPAADRLTEECEPAVHADQLK